MHYETIIGFLSAIALGALIGTEREMVYRDNKTNHPLAEFGGIRTFMLLSLLGAISSYVAVITGNWSVLAVSGALVLATIVTHYAFSTFKLSTPGATTEIAGMVTFVLGAISTIGYAWLAVSLATITTLILFSKHYVSTLLEHISREELYSTLRFAVILFVVLPTLPAQPLDPWGILQLQNLWIVVILISAISYVGYIASKIFGNKKGIIVSGIFGGLASSTAVASAMAEQSKSRPSIVHPFVIATVIASSMMFARVLFWVMSFHPEMVTKIVLPVALMSIISAIGVTIVWFGMKKASSANATKEVPLESPFRILPAIKFALFFLAVSALSYGSLKVFGHSGTYIISTISGLADVDAISISLATQAKDSLITDSLAAQGMTLAMITNTLVKVALAIMFGGKKYARISTLLFLFVIVAGGVSFFLI